jgi:hypothetical protein
MSSSEYWPDIPDEVFEQFQRRVELVEFLLDESISTQDKPQPKRKPTGMCTTSASAASASVASGKRNWGRTTAWACYEHRTKLLPTTTTL